MSQEAAKHDQEKVSARSILINLRGWLDAQEEQLRVRKGEITTSIAVDLVEAGLGDLHLNSELVILHSPMMFYQWR